MKIAITGGSSYIGQHLVPMALAANHEITYTYFTKDPLGYGQLVDTRSLSDLTAWLTSFQPDVIIHLAGSNRGEDMSNVITQGASNISQIAQELNARLLHISTDVLFDGKGAPYDETAVPAPMHEYGRAKAEAETIISQCPNHLIIRTSLIYGTTLMDEGTRWMKEAIEQGYSINLFTDHHRNPVWVVQLSQALLELADHTYTGVLNVAGSQVITRSEFSSQMLAYWGVTLSDLVTLSADTTGRFPKDCRLDSTLAKQILDTPLWGVDEVLEKAKSAE